MEIIDKIISKVIIDDRSSINIMFESTMNKMELKNILKIILMVTLTDQRPSQCLV